LENSQKLPTAVEGLFMEKMMELLEQSALKRQLLSLYAAELTPRSSDCRRRSATY
jgi:hypothetical protein